MKRFGEYLEGVGVMDSGVGGSQDPAATQGIGNRGIQTHSIDGDKTRANSDGFRTQPVDSGVVSAISNLKGHHEGLKQIFSDIRKRALAFNSDQVRNSFDQAMTGGIDQIGRAHAMLLPSGNSLR